MADESAKGILGHLPPWPRKALNNSVIAMEQAYRQRKGLPLISDADIEALKAGQPMSWESGDGAPIARTPAPVSPPAPATPAAAPTTPAAPPVPASASTDGAGISEEVATWVAQGKKWSKSAIAAEQARRGRKNLAPLNNAEITALLGEPAEAAAPTPAPAATTAAAPAAPRPAAAPAVDRVPEASPLDRAGMRLAIP